MTSDNQAPDLINVVFDKDNSDIDFAATGRGKNYVPADLLAAKDAEIERLRGHIVWLEAEIKENGFPKEGPMRTRCRAALAEGDNR